MANFLWRQSRHESRFFAGSYRERMLKKGDYFDNSGLLVFAITKRLPSLFVPFVVSRTATTCQNGRCQDYACTKDHAQKLDIIWHQTKTPQLNSCQAARHRWQPTHELSLPVSQDAIASPIFPITILNPERKRHEHIL